MNALLGLIITIFVSGGGEITGILEKVEKECITISRQEGHLSQADSGEEVYHIILRENIDSIVKQEDGISMGSSNFQEGTWWSVSSMKVTDVLKK